MGINQFAKISPVVNSAGVLLDKDENGNYFYNEKSNIKLKNNEMGICIDDNSILVMFNNNPVKLSGGLYNNMESAKMYVDSNDDGQYDGQLLIVKTDPTNLYVIIGKQLYNLTEHTTKTIVVEIPNEVNTNTHRFIEIENSVMQEQDSKEYLINSIDLVIPGNSYSFKNSNMANVTDLRLIIYGSENGGNNTYFDPTNIDNMLITDSCYNNITRFINNFKCKGKLCIAMKDLSDLDIHQYTGSAISLIITYTTLN